MNGIKQVSTALIQHIKSNAPAFDGVGIAVPSPGNLFLLVFDEQAGGDYKGPRWMTGAANCSMSGSEPERLKKANAVGGVLAQMTAS